MELGSDNYLKFNDPDERLRYISLRNEKLNNAYLTTLHRITTELKRNIYGCDLMVCYFIAALNSYRRDRCVRPFPSFYINQTGKDFTTLQRNCNTIPSLLDIVNDSKKCSKEVLDILKWLLLDKDQFYLKKTNLNFVSVSCNIDNKYKPNFVFEVCYTTKIEESWLKRKGDRDIIIAFHGSSNDNFYSILKVGLQQHFSLDKEVLYGKGIYLSNELSLCAHYAPYSMTWEHSLLGHKHSTIAVCEIINDTKKVKCKDASNKERSHNNDSYDEIPEKYFVVTDNDMVRVKYLLVYRENNSVKSYLRRHICIFLIIFYFAMLCCVGVHFNTSFTRYIKNFIKHFIY